MFCLTYIFTFVFYVKKKVPDNISLRLRGMDYYIVINRPKVLNGINVEI